jgi:hypothetical protein
VGKKLTAYNHDANIFLLFRRESRKCQQMGKVDVAINKCTPIIGPGID